MEPIISSTTGERIARTALFALVVPGFCAWSFWDGYVAYPRQNMTEAIATMGADVPDPPPVILDDLTEARVAEIEPRRPLGELEAELGTDAFRHEGKAYFFGPGGRLRVDVRGNRATRVEWVDGTHDEQFQKGMALVLSPFGLFCIFRLVRVVRTRVSLTEAGLQIGGRPPIPYEAMKGFSSERYRKTGWIELQYSIDGSDRKLRLDNYVIKEFRPIVEAICEKTGLDDPLPPRGT